MGKVLKVKVIDKNSNKTTYLNEVNLQDPNLVKLVFEDLSNLFDAPMTKVCKLFLNEREKVFPFSP